MDKTTIQISQKTLERLKALKRFERESYDDILNNLVDETEDDTLNDEDIEELKDALDNVKKGYVKSIEKVAEEMGISLD